MKTRIHRHHFSKHAFEVFSFEVIFGNKQELGFYIHVLGFGVTLTFINELKKKP